MGRNGREAENWRSFHGNYQADHVQKAKLQNRYTHAHIYNVRASGHRSGGSFTEVLRCPPIHLQTWKSRPNHCAEPRKQRDGDRGHLGREKPPAAIALGAWGLAWVHISSQVALPLVRARASAGSPRLLIQLFRIAGGDTQWEVPPGPALQGKGEGGESGPPERKQHCRGRAGEGDADFLKNSSCQGGPTPSLPTCS
jgi:hypothetical protein